MIQPDTVRLLRECDAGAKMGVSSIGDMLRYAHADALTETLIKSRAAHADLGGEIREELDRFGDEGKDPNPVAEKMSWLKTNVKLKLHESDSVIADLITDGCNMGIKSLNQYLNEYAAADERSKDVAKKLIKLEKKLADDVRDYL